jgi:hypothetical protein
MMIRTRFPVIALAVALTASMAHANQRSGLKPQVLRQIYSDQTYSEIECQRPDPELQVACEFRRSVAGSTSTWTFDLSNSGYFMSVDKYRYVPSQSSFFVAFDVSCNDQDLRLNAGANEHSTHCTLWLTPIGDRLSADHVEITSMVDGEFTGNTRAVGQRVEP